MGQLVDFQTGKVLNEGVDVKDQQYALGKEAIMGVLSEIVEVLELEGYRVQGGVLILPNRDEAVTPTAIGISTTGTASDMLKIMMPAMESVLNASEKETHDSE